MFFAIREMRRTLGRFALLTGAVALLVMLLLFFQSVAGALTSGLTGGLDSNEAEIVVYGDKARKNPAASFLSPEVVDAVAAVEGVTKAAGVGRSQFVESGTKTDVTVVGLMDPSLGGPREITTGTRASAAGEALASAPSLGEDGFDTGQSLTVEDVSLEVVGTADGAAFDVSPTLYVSYDDLFQMAQNRAGTDVPPSISWVAVVAGSDADLDQIASRINNDVEGVQALTRDDAVAALPGVGQITQSFNILYLLLFIVVTIVTGVFFLILTVQKQDSLVLMRALGSSKWDVVKPVLIEVLFVVGFGSVIGVLVAAGLLYIARDTFGQSLDPVTTVVSVAFILVLGLLASLGSVRRVLAIDPLAATRTPGEEG